MSTRMSDAMARLWREHRHQPIEKRVRALAGGDVVVDSTRAALVWEPRRVVPSFAVPAGDVLAGLRPAGAGTPEVPPGVLHPGIPFAAHTAPGEPVDVGDRPGAGYLLEAPRGYVVLDFAAFDGWLEEDEPVLVHPIDPYHRVDVRRSSRHVRIELDDELIADTTRPVLLFETSLPTRFYIPLEDVAADLRRSDTRSRCPFKGEAGWWSLPGAKDIGWTYETTRPETAVLRGHVAFWDERVDVIVDGERRERPGGAVSRALRDEVGV